MQLHLGKAFVKNKKNNDTNLAYRLLIKATTVCVVALLLTVSISVLLSSNLYAATGDEVRASKKIVSVVYDDSGSMIGDRWSYANYSMQALIALLNEQDELYITFMSKPDVSQEISLSSLQASVNMIHDMAVTRYTPEQAIDTAVSRLESIDEPDPSTQFWFIVMTDGEIFDDLESQGNVIDIQSKMDSYKNLTMSN